jgi:hypothetical protein
VQRFDCSTRVKSEKIERSLLYKTGFFLNSQMLIGIGQGMIMMCPDVIATQCSRTCRSLSLCLEIFNAYFESPSKTTVWYKIQTEKYRVVTGPAGPLVRSGLVWVFFNFLHGFYQKIDEKSAFFRK